MDFGPDVVVKLSVVEKAAIAASIKQHTSTSAASKESYPSSAAAGGAGASVAAPVAVGGKMRIGSRQTAVRELQIEVDYSEAGAQLPFPAGGKLSSPHQYCKYIGEPVEGVPGAVYIKKPLDQTSALFKAAAKLNVEIGAFYSMQVLLAALMLLQCCVRRNFS